MKRLRRWIARLFCPHVFKFVANTHGDWIIIAGYRSWWVCKFCGKDRYLQRTGAPGEVIA